MGAVGTLYNAVQSGDIVLKIIFIALLLIGIISAICIYLKEKINQPLLLKCNRTGILDIQHDGKCSNEKMSDKIRNAEKIDIFFYAGSGFFNAFQNELVDALEKNRAEIHIIIGTTNSLFLNDLDKIEFKYHRGSTRSISTEIDIIKSYIEEWREKRAVGKGTIELKHFSTELRMSMILIKLKNGEEWGWITLAMPPIKAIDTISFEIENNSEGVNLYKQSKKHFDSVWNILPKDKQ